MTLFMSLAVTGAEGDADVKGGTVVLGPGDGARDIVGVGVRELRNF
jgi:hypothetical protein